MFEISWLRTFLAVADTGSFTVAGRRLGVSQPTVSHQVRKLEAAAGRVLLDRDTRTIVLTADGEALVRHAREILASHAAAVAHFSAPQVSGRLRFGVADDLATSQLPRILREFRAQNPLIELELDVNQSNVLYRRLQAGRLDLVYVKQYPSGTDPVSLERGVVVSTEELVWVGDATAISDPRKPVPLVVYQSPSITRDLATRAIEGAGRSWRVVCNTRDVSGIVAALRAGIGVSALPLSLAPPDIDVIPERFSFPTLGAVSFSLLTHPGAPAEATSALAASIRRAARGRPPARPPGPDGDQGR